jgi:uncharacterized protein (DUF2147 family)
MAARRAARIVLLGATLVAPCGASDAIRGLWATPSTDAGSAHVRIEAADDALTGTIVWLSEPSFPPTEPSGLAGRPKTDRRNPDPALRERPIVGLRILSGLRAAGPSTWSGGTIYDPESGKTYRCRVRLAEDGTLRLRGFIAVSLLGRTTTWTRVPE